MNSDSTENDDYRKMLKEMLDAIDKNFSDKQINWLESLYKQTYSFSSRQKEIIEDIYKNKM